METDIDSQRHDTCLGSVASTLETCKLSATIKTREEERALNDLNKDELSSSQIFYVFF